MIKHNSLSDVSSIGNNITDQLELSNFPRINVTEINNKVNLESMRNDRNGALLNLENNSDNQESSKIKLTESMQNENSIQKTKESLAVEGLFLLTKSNDKSNLIPENIEINSLKRKREFEIIPPRKINSSQSIEFSQQSLSSEIEDHQISKLITNNNLHKPSRSILNENLLYLISSTISRKNDPNYSRINLEKDIEDIYYEDAKCREKKNFHEIHNFTFNKKELDEFFGKAEVKTPSIRSERRNNILLSKITSENRFVQEISEKNEEEVFKENNNQLEEEEDFENIDTNYENTYFNEMENEDEDFLNIYKSGKKRKSKHHKDSDKGKSDKENKTKLAWTEEEVRALFEGIKNYPREWKTILSNPKLKNRTITSIKEKYRISMIKAWEGDRSIRRLINEYIDFETIAVKEGIPSSAEHYKKRKGSIKVSSQDIIEDNENFDKDSEEFNEKKGSNYYMEAPIKWTQAELDSLHYIFISTEEDQDSLKDWKALLKKYPFSKGRSRCSVLNKYGRMKSKGQLAPEVYGNPVFSLDQLKELSKNMR